MAALLPLYNHHLSKKPTNSIMSLRQFIQKLENAVNIKQLESRLAGHLGVAKSIVNGFDAALHYPIVDGVLQTILPPAITTALPKIEQALDRVVSDLTIGMAIGNDIHAAAGTEAKVKVLLSDLQRYGKAAHDMFLQKLLALLVSEMDNHSLRQSLYDFYAQADYVTHLKK
jgi:hypothetical protein